MNRYFYIGSCRYQGLFRKNFPPRLHSTKEIIYFLEQSDSIESDSLNHPELINFLYGDIYHSMVKDKSLLFIEDIKTNKKLPGEILVLEICSRKYQIINSKPVNSFYLKNPSQDIEISDKEIYEDLVKIYNLSVNLHGYKYIIVIPHLDLETSPGVKIAARTAFKNTLKKHCDDLDIYFVDIGDAFYKKSFDGVFRDATHYSSEGQAQAFHYLRQQTRMIEQLHTLKNHNLELRLHNANLLTKIESLLEAE